MNHDTDLHNDDFMKEAKRMQMKMAAVGFTFLLIAFLVVVTTIYAFLAAAGVVPPTNAVPVVPYV